MAVPTPEHACTMTEYDAVLPLAFYPSKNYLTIAYSFILFYSFLCVCGGGWVGADVSLIVETERLQYSGESRPD